MDEIQPDTPDDYNHEIQKEIFEVMAELADWEKGEFVGVIYDDHWYPGIISSFLNDGRVEVKCMHYFEKDLWTNKFEWPKRKDEKPYDKEDLILKLEPPQEQGSKRLKFFSFSEDDYTGASDLLSAILETR